MIDFGLDSNAVILDPDWQEKISNAVRHRFREAANFMEQVAQMYVPYRTGRLSKSIKAYVRQPKGTIFIELVATAPYAAHVEYGTGRRGAATVYSGMGASTSEMRKVGKPAFPEYGPQGGMEAQPFLRPALVQTAKVFFDWGT